MELSNRIVITSIGVVASTGVGSDTVWESIVKGKSGVKKIKSFDTSIFNCKHACEIQDLNPKEYIGKKGLRFMDNITQYLLVASKFALADRDRLNEMGVVVGTAFGGLHSIFDFEQKALKEGLLGVSPMQFPNTVINAPASQINVKHGVMKLSETISTCSCSGLDAIGQSAKYIKQKECESILCGGADELNIESFAGIHKSGLLFESTEDEQYSYKCIPFDKSSEGILLGEGAALFVIESLENAIKNNREILAEIAGYSSNFVPYKHNKQNPDTDGAVRAMKAALANANLNPENIDYISANANGNISTDKIELKAIKETFNNYYRDVPISSIKSILGDCFGASGAFQVLSAIMTINNSIIPPTLNYNFDNNEYEERFCISNKAIKRDVNTCLINTFGKHGHYSSLILKKFHQS